jgi:dihydroorotate dehydrogenase
LRFLNPELASHISLEALKKLQTFKEFFAKSKKEFHVKESNSKFIHAGNLKFDNYLGLAAGLDKEGKYFSALGALGFGFVEVGTFTPYRQKGNDLPRIKRIPYEKSLINRLGFNNPGISQGIKNISLSRHKYSGVLGISIGKSLSTPLDRAYEDYVFCLKACYEYADYIAINISSPNTEGLRELSTEIYFKRMLSEIHAEYKKILKKTNKKVPLILKISPDEDHTNLSKIIEVSLENEISGFIVSNTKYGSYQDMQGGISGNLLKDKSLVTQKIVSSYVDKKSIIIASGGISSKEDIEERMDYGADLVQIYTSFVYDGPPIIEKLLN